MRDRIEALHLMLNKHQIEKEKALINFLRVEKFFIKDNKYPAGKCDCIRCVDRLEEENTLLKVSVN